MANKTPNKVITAVAFLGCSSIVTGVTLIYHPLGYITTGVISTDAGEPSGKKGIKQHGILGTRVP